MVVAAGAVDRDAQEDLPRRRDDAVENVVAGQGLVGGFVVPDPQPVEARGDQRLGRVAVDLVAGKLFVQEPVVGLVAVERIDHVVAIPPGERLGRVALVAVGLGVANQVQPVPAPGLAVTGRGEQPIDQSLVGIADWSAQKSSTSSGVGGRPVRS